MGRGSRHQKWDKFIIPSEVLATLSDACSAAPLLQLPTEILIIIFDKVNLIDQLCLALACKHLLQVSTVVSMDASEPDALSMQALHYQLHPTTKDWRTCFGCTQYRPKRERYWIAKADKEKWAETEAKQYDMMTIIHDWEHRHHIFYCPECLGKMGCFK
ncbi:hypothetical protein VF21_06296 [Pseudogymnoascus sp. 05NY08]|nr:hypothetical protein VF21_06296 [Pseudogymnoascus sp. 05NY08]